MTTEFVEVAEHPCMPSFMVPALAVRPAVVPGCYICRFISVSDMKPRQYNVGLALSHSIRLGTRNTDGLVDLPVVER